MVGVCILDDGAKVGCGKGRFMHIDALGRGITTIEVILAIFFAILV